MQSLQQQQISALGGFTVFVGHIPSSMNEEGVSQIFNKFGNILDITIIKDKRTNVSKGCAFITFSNKEEADNALNTTNESGTFLENMNKPLQVKYSDNEIEKMERKLFIGMLGTSDEDQIRGLFGNYGLIEELTIVREKDGKPKGYGFIKFSTREESDNALREIDGKHTLAGSNLPIIVKFADTERQKRKKLLGVGNNQGQQQQQNPAFNFYQQQQPQQQQNQQQPNQYQPFFYGQNNQMSQAMGNGGGYRGGYQQQQQQQPNVNFGMMQGNPAFDYNQQNQQQPNESNDLFIYYLPFTYGDEELKQLFAPYGNVVSSKVFIDKNTQQSKCFGFVSYDNTQSAIQAIQELNGRAIEGKKLKVNFKREKQF